jgi:hypothetical protein
MNGLTENFHSALSGIQTFEVALGVCGLLILAIVYVSVSHIQRPQRLPLNICAGTALVLTVIVVVCLAQYNSAVDYYRTGHGMLFPQPSDLTIILAPVALMLIVITVGMSLVQAWTKSTPLQRSALVLGGMTLINASLCVAAGCWSYYLAFESPTEIFMNHVKVNGRDFAVLLGIAFAVPGLWLLSTTIQAIQSGTYYREPIEGVPTDSDDTTTSAIRGGHQE